MVKVEILPISFADDFGGEILGCDIAVPDDTAALSDFLTAMDSFAAQYLADCRGCDGCCRERAPLIAADIPALAQLLPDSEFPAHAVCRHFATLEINRDGAVDIYLRRNLDGSCCLLDQDKKICLEHCSRSFVCRSHFCIPRSKAISDLRAEIVNAGEDELIRLLLAEESSGAAPLTDEPLRQLIAAADYPPNPQSHKQSYNQIILKDALSPELWQSIKKEG